MSRAIKLVPISDGEAFFGRAGDEIGIPITISEWENAYAAIKIDVIYDETILELDSLEASSTDFGGATTASNGNEIGFLAAPSSDKQAAKVDGGEICVANFFFVVCNKNRFC